MAIPENAEVHRGEETNHTPPSSQPEITMLGANSVPPPSPVPGPPPPASLERLFSRGAARNSPVSLNRMFSRGALGRAGSSSLGSWSRTNRASTTDSKDEDYGEDRVETLTEGASPLLLSKKTAKKDDDDDDDDPVIVPTGAGTLAKQSSSTSSTSARRKFPELAKAIEKLQQVSEHLVEATCQVDTYDHQDHTFSGIYFDLTARRLLPYEFLEIQSISVRGELGLMSVYSTDKTCEGKLTEKDAWIRNFGPRELPPSMTVLFELVLDIPIRLSPGMSKGLYIHSQLPGDMALVYDERRSHLQQDKMLRFHTGIAHTSHVAFSANAPWGGTAFRRSREFVGSMRYGVKMLMWTPETHLHFPRVFRNAIFTLMCTQNALRAKARSLGALPQDVMFHIINMLPWNWFLVDGAEPDMSDSEDDDDGGEEKQFKYGGHVGRIAEMRRLFDTARLQNAGTVLPNGTTMFPMPADQEEEQVLEDDASSLE